MRSNNKKGTIYILFSLCFILCICSIHSQAEEPASNPQVQDNEATKLSVDLDFKDADIKDVARAFSSISGVNIIVSDDVKAKITLKIQAMDWQEALNMILEAYNITAIKEKNYIVITTLEKRRLAEESGDLQTRVITLNFVNVGDMQKTLASMLTSRGKIEVDTRTNSLVVTDILDRIDNLQEVALKLDTKTPQVMIEAMLLTVKLNDDQKLGVNWDITHKTRDEREFKQDLDIGGTSGTDFFWQIKYGKTLLSWANISAVIDAFVEQKKANILANPRVLTLDNLSATIELIEQVPYTQQVTSTESASSVSSTQFKDVPITLSVKPHITKDNYIFMNIKTEQSFRSGFTSDNQPIVDSRRAETDVMVKDGETIVIGGLRKKEDTTTVDKLPILGDMPLVGFMFRKTVKSKVDTELLIFVTPHISSEAVLSEKEAKQYEKFMEIKTAKKTKLFEGTIPFTLRAPER